MEGNFPEYDIQSSKAGNIEVKEDRMAHNTGNYAIEYKDGHDKPSGIAITTAELYILVDWEWVVVIPTHWLKELSKGYGNVAMGYKRLARGRLVPRDKILNSELATVIERWFPVYE